jgi:hypothetical protein
MTVTVAVGDGAAVEAVAAAATRNGNVPGL